MRDMTFIELLLFVLLPGGCFMIVIMFVWDEFKRCEDEIAYLRQKGKEEDKQ